MTREQALLPSSEQRVRIVSGIDFTRPVDEVTALLTEKVTDIDTVTHVVYTAYRVPPEKGPMPLRAANDALLETSITAITALAPRIQSVDIIKRLSAEAVNSWTFTEVRPDTIIGFVPGIKAMNVAQGLGFYLSLFLEVHGARAQCAYPGTAAG
ncbi:putative sirq protein [Diaporthe ampelina]|uniref:Putative sirq protein n=1 Tax=Diaporthe ampelina TaxID=1214573 RepID=A0A0G2FEW8_9PEZI|nr:putative sirq protein [Diaporthe ampelina]